MAWPVDERVPHAGGDGGRLRRLAEPEHALDDGQLRARGVQAAERAPVVDHHPRRDHLAAPVHCAGLHTKPTVTSGSGSTEPRTGPADWDSPPGGPAAGTTAHPGPRWTSWGGPGHPGCWRHSRTRPEPARPPSDGTPPPSACRPGSPPFPEAEEDNMEE